MFRKLMYCVLCTASFYAAAGGGEILENFDDEKSFAESFSLCDIRKVKVNGNPFSLNEGKLVWKNLRSNIAMILFRNNVKFTPETPEQPVVAEISIIDGTWGASNMGLAVFSNSNIEPDKSGDGYTFTQRQGRLRLQIWQNGKAQDVKIPTTKVKPGVSLRISRNADNVYTFSFAQTEGAWKTVTENDTFAKSAIPPCMVGIFAASGWWKGEVYADNFKLINCKVSAIEKQDVSCLILNDRAGLPLNQWQEIMTPGGFKCMEPENPRALDETTDLSNIKLIVINMGQIHERFARKLEEWVKQGGIALIYRSPATYTKDSKRSGTVSVPIVIDGKKTQLMQGLIRITRAAPFDRGELKSISGGNSVIFQKLKNGGTVTPGKKLDVSALHLITGFPNREFGDMELLSAKIAKKDGDVSEGAVVIRNRYGKGISYYTTLPLDDGDKFGRALREALIAQIKADESLPPLDAPLYNNPPGKESSTVITEVAEEKPERPAPPKNCILELQGDEFNLAIGSPGWAPWRIALTSTDGTPIEKTFKINHKGSLWMDIQGAFGDHREPPLMEVHFNGHRLMRQLAPWRRIPFSAQNYRVLYPVRFYIPASMLQKENTLKITNLGLEWYILDFVRFFPVDNDNSLEKAIAEDKTGDDEYKVKTASGLKVDGKLDEEIWKNAEWKTLPGNPERLKPLSEEEKKLTGKNAPPPYVQTSFAMLSDKENLYIAVKTVRNTVAQLAVSYPGCKDAYLFSFDQKGLVSCMNHDGEIIATPAMKTASHELKDGTWTMEAAIPLSLIPGEDNNAYRPSLRKFLPLGRKVSFNFFRRTNLEKDAAEWESLLPFNYMGKQTTFISRSRKIRVPYLFMYDNLEDATMFIQAPENIIHLPELFHWGNNSISVDNPANRNQYAKIVVRPNNQKRLEYTFQLKDGRNEIPCMLNFPGETEVSVQLYDKQNNMTALAMRQTEIGQPFRIRAGRSFYTSEKNASLEVDFNYPNALEQATNELTAELYQPDGVIQRVTRKVKGDKTSFTFDISKLPAGDYETYLTAAFNGRKYAQPSAIIRKLPPAETEVKLRADGFMLVNDKPFFPMGILIDQYNANNDLTFIKDGGLNTAVIWRDISDKEIQQAHKEGIHLIFSTTGTHGGAGDWMVNYQGTSKNLKKTRNQPAVIGYYPIDEPEYWHAPNCVPLQLQRFNEFAAGIDPYRPNMISHGVGNIHYCRSEGMTFNDAVDIRLYEIYSRPESIAKRMDQVKTFGKNDKAIAWMFLRVGGSPRHNLVSSVQYRAEAYTSLICGARGIIYFLQRMARWNGAEHWPEVSKALSDEIQTMATSKMKETSTAVELETDNKDIRVTAWMDGNDMWFAAVNIKPETSEVNAKLPEMKKLSGTFPPLFQEMDKLTINQGTIKIKLPAYGVGCWRIPITE